MKLSDDGKSIDLRDENDLRPTDGALAILASVLIALDNTDYRWDGQGKPGVPSVTDYSEDVIVALKRWLR